MGSSRSGGNLSDGQTERVQTRAKGAEAGLESRREARRKEREAKKKKDEKPVI